MEVPKDMLAEDLCPLILILIIFPTLTYGIKSFLTVSRLQMISFGCWSDVVFSMEIVEMFDWLQAPTLFVCIIAILTMETELIQFLVERLSCSFRNMAL